MSKSAVLEVKKNDRILFGKYSGIEICIEYNEYLIIRESDVLLIEGENNAAKK